MTSKNRFLIAIIAILLSVISSACSVPLSNGGRLYILGGPSTVVVTNNTKYDGELQANGQRLGDLRPGQTFNAELSRFRNHNLVLTFKAYTFQPGIPDPVYVGMTSRNFVASNSRERQEWVINFIQKARS